MYFRTIFLTVVIFFLAGCTSPSIIKNKYGEFSLDKAISIAQSPTPNIWSNGYEYQNRGSTIRSAALDYLKFASESNNLWLLNGKRWSDVNMENCYAKVNGLGALMTSAAGERWNRHGRQDIDELHSISENQMFWIGRCENGKASGQGIISWLYAGKINKNSTLGFVRAVVFMKDGIPSGRIEAYSNADTCFNVCYARHYENKLLGLLNNGDLISDQAAIDTKNQVNAANNAMGAILGGVVLKAAEIVKEGAASSSSSSGAAGRFSIYKDKGTSASWMWHKREVVVKCESGRKNGDLPSVYLESSGRWSSTYVGGKFDSLHAAAVGACS